MTDAYTEEIFRNDDSGPSLVFPISRLIVDPERFSEDSQEPMAQRGMGVIYTKTSTNRPLRNDPSCEERESLLNRYYWPHHKRFESMVEKALSAFDKCLIIDCHSFPSSPRWYELDKMEVRPDICLGVDSYHTPDSLVDLLKNEFTALGYSVDINRPYAGSIVPLKFYQKDKRVQSIMIEINRSVYMDEESGNQLGGFEQMLQQIPKILNSLTSKF